ncbi:RNA-directed DNA polymerase [Flavobacterium sp. XN-5]|uniref:RNA-directed DNA polymerase n=1 Tax=Flavobacterium sp. XN-5 TaxID=2599390 RepID=UPI0011C8E2EF|nr:RNA-directed DNA polymerase [Flavobacterium sp. XN-5]NGY38976.1 RNA-directed DNA polymerase [Flavobacterium sp. XN-5]
MTEKKLIEKGYLAKELPPQFITYPLANNLVKVKKEWKAKFSSLSKERRKFFGETKSTVFNLPKVSLSRRTLSIPNPIHQIKLTEFIITNWKEIDNTLKLSKSSYTIPIEDPKGNRAFTTKSSFGEFKRERFIKSFDNYYEVKSDISKFYGSIYTHSIPWLLHTKATAKIKRDDYTLIGNELDRILRSSNSGQTVGIPIGPDTSLIVSEIINCKIDEILQSKFKSNNIKFFRFIDDIYIYCDSYSEAEKSFKFYQKTLAEYQLDINEEKTEITKTPFDFDTKWSIELGSFKFRNNPKSQITDLERFTSLSFDFARKHHKDSVLLFTIQVLKGIALYDENWDFYESVILKVLLTEPRTFESVAQILCSNKSRVNKDKLRGILNKLIENHINKGHQYEVSWALTICKEFNIKLKDSISELIFNSNDLISILVALDLKKLGLINSTVDTSFLQPDLIEENLINEYWLFTYESVYKGWLTSPKDVLNNNEFFKILKENKIYFYDENAKIPTFKFKSGDEIDEENKDVKLEYSTAKQIFTGGGGGGGY